MADAMATEFIDQQRRRDRQICAAEVQGGVTAEQQQQRQALGCAQGSSTPSEKSFRIGLALSL
jgi:hypothetical protein